MPLVFSITYGRKSADFEFFLTTTEGTEISRRGRGSPCISVYSVSPMKIPVPLAIRRGAPAWAPAARAATQGRPYDWAGAPTAYLNSLWRAAGSMETPW